MREELTVIAAQINGLACVHFTSTKLQGDDLWLPIAKAESWNIGLHRTIEGLMVANGLAHNVTSVEEIRRGQQYIDYRVTYNLPQTEDTP